MAIKEAVIKKSALSPTILIVGGAGFIGSHLANSLLERDARVIVLDNLKTGKDIYVTSLTSNPKFGFFDVDINQGIPEYIQSVDYIVHLAGVESYLYSRDTANLDSLLTNAVGTKNLLDLAKKSEAKFLLVSSIEVYQGLLSPINLDQYFGKTLEEEKKYSLNEAKRFAEALVWEYYKNSQTDVRIVRLPEVYGPRMNLNSSGELGRILKQVLDNKAIDIFGDGTEEEYYLYISDAISGISKALFNKNTEGKIFTLAPEESHATLEIAYLLKSLADREIQMNFRPSVGVNKRGKPRKPDNENISILKWDQKVPFKQGLETTLKWFGYEPNNNSFKPNKLIQDRAIEKATQSGLLVSSIIGNNQVVVNQPQEKISISPKEILPTPIKKPSISFKFPKISLPKFRAPSVNLRIKAPSAKFTNSIFSQNANVLAALAAFLVALTFFTVVPFGLTAYNTKKGVEKLEQMPQLMAEINPDGAKASAKEAFESFYKAQKSLKQTKWMFNLIGKRDSYISTSALLASATSFSKGAYYSTQAAVPFSKMWDLVKPNSNVEFDGNAFVAAEVNLKEAKNHFQQALAEYKRVDVNTLSDSFKEKTELYGKVLNSLVSGIDTVSALSSEMPALLGANDQIKRYLVLFQNSHEIRPTGGFIGSYAIVEIQNGKIISLNIDDIYNPDGQINVRNIKEAPPQPLGKILNEDRAYIRNSNWNPNFPTSAEEIRRLYTKVTDKQIDGVIGVDLYFAEEIMNVTGSVFLTAFGEEINQENLYERTQFHSEFNYENGSDQKKTFLTIFGGKLLEAIFALPESKMPQLLTQLNNALLEKHLMIYLPNSAFSAKLNEHNWDGGLEEVSNSDYLYVVNANVGGTKANYFVENKMNYTVTSQTRDGLLRGILTLEYKHTGEDNAWPGGPYKNYIRVLTQTGAKLTGANITVDDKEPKDIFKEVVIGKEGKYDSFGTLVELQPKENMKLVITYDLPQNISLTEENMKYALYWQKQPGTKEDPFIFKFEPPFGLKANGSNEMYVESRLDKDKQFSLTLE